MTDKEKEIRQLAQQGRDLIGAGDPPEDLSLTDALELIRQARDTSNTDALIDAIANAYYMGLAVGHGMRAPAEQ